MAKDLVAWAKKAGVSYFMVSFTDLFGAQRAKLVPAPAMAEMQGEGAGFAGFATWLDMTPAYPDMLAVPDPDSVIQLPWKPDVAWVAGDLVMEDAPVPQAPRGTLKRLVAAAADQGMRVKTGIEAEYFLTTPDGTAISDPQDTAEKPCYDQQAVMRRYDVIAEVCDYMLALGWGPYQNDHEDANGQFEMNFEFDDVLATADKHSFFKFMVKSVAEKHGLPERFSLIQPDQISYEFTIEDPDTFTTPWTARSTLHRSDKRRYEYACHEGNYSMPGILKGARLLESEHAGSAGG